MTVQEFYRIYLQHPVVCTDTRQISEGCIFFALKGPNFDANTFSGEALDKGASYCVVDNSEYAVSGRCLLVDDVLTSLQELARHHRQQLGIPVVAIAGSNGKTTTKELVNAVLSTQLRVWATPGNLNNHIGVPLTLLRIRTEHDIAVIEIGANHIGENGFLCSIARPGYGIVTNNGMDHLEGFGDLEGVARSNSELYYHLLQHGGTAFVNANDEWLMRMSSRLDKVITYAANTKEKSGVATYTGTAHTLQPGITFTFLGQQGSSSLSGDYNFDNIMAAAAIGKTFGISTENIIRGIASYVPANNRSQWIRREHNLVFMDAYNANPSSMEVALKNFAGMDSEEKLVIVGDMFEMGSHAEAGHQQIVDLCKQLGFRNVLLVGNDFCNTRDHTYRKFKTTAEAAGFLRENTPFNSTVFIKGSRGMRLETLLDLIP